MIWLTWCLDKRAVVGNDSEVCDCVQSEIQASSCIHLFILQVGMTLKKGDFGMLSHK